MIHEPILGPVRPILARFLAFAGTTGMVAGLAICNWTDAPLLGLFVADMGALLAAGSIVLRR